MRVTYITAGAAGTICGNCLADNALASSLRNKGHDVVLLPAYTPLLTDERDVSHRRVVLSGMNLYLQSKHRFFRSNGWLDPLLDHPRVLRWVSGVAVDTDPAELGAMTRDTFLGEDGPYAREFAKAIDLLRKLEPDVVHLTNSMLVSLAAPVKRELGVPVVCSIQGEADFIQALPDSYRTESAAILRRHARHVDRWVAPCHDQIDSMSQILGDLGSGAERIFPGITLDGHRNRAAAASEGFVVGFLARVSEEKGLGMLADAVRRLKEAHPGRKIELRVAGWRAAGKQPFIDALRRRHGFEDLGYLSRQEKLEFLAELDAFSVPTTYRASKGLYVLEAMAAAVPVVQPRVGVFPELVRATQGGLECRPGDSRDLARKLEALMENPEMARELGRAGQQAVRSRFTAGHRADETLTLYDRVLESAGE